MNRRVKKRKLPIGFGKRLEQAVIDSGLTPAQIERLTHVHHSNLIEYMREDMMPTAYNLWALCKVLNVSADYLLGLKEDNNAV